jgi:adenine-specific DNA-methyltransferase
LKLKDDTAICLPKGGGEPSELPVADLVSVAEFGEAIYPYLKPVDSVCNAPDSDLWHTLIEADNYHALQLLEYLYAGKVDCIYIDPPYNTGARDWKYNNDYVDGVDTYRHSKWLSMMQKRLKLAKKLLNPKDSVLIVTIDEKEYLHLGCLLEEMFPDANIQMVSSVINSHGAVRQNQFSRTDEYIFFVQFGDSSIQRLPLDDEWRLNINDKRTTKMLWSMLIRTGTHVLREDSKNQFYPIFVYDDGKLIHSVGEPYYGSDRNEVIAPEGTIAIWPIRSNGDEGNWQVSCDNLRDLIDRGFVRLGKISDRGMAVSYLKRGEIKKVESGIYDITGKRYDGSVIDRKSVV